MSMIVPVLAAAVVATNSLPRLLTCPDCGHQLSRRAVMCVGCGAGKVAVDEAIKIEAERLAKHLTAVFDDGRRVELETVECRGHCFAYGWRADFHDFSTVIIRNEKFNEEVPYSTIWTNDCAVSFGLDAPDRVELIKTDKTWADFSKGAVRVAPKEFRKLGEPKK